MLFVRRIASKLNGKSASIDNDIASLEAADVPISTADCRQCPDPCDEGHDEYPKKFNVDLETTMRGSVKPYRRQVVISTGKTDWPHEITDAKGTLAAHLSDTLSKLAPTPAPASAPDSASDSTSAVPPSVFKYSQSARLAILNASHTSSVAPDARPAHAVLVFPDYKAVCAVTPCASAAAALWHTALDPAVGRAGAPHAAAAHPFQTWTLPYNCVLLLCSHKRRDNRCAVAAPKLESGFTQTLHAAGWSVDTQLDDLASTGAPLETCDGTADDRELEVLQRLKATCDQPHKRALILRTSHVGGHKFAGNVIIHTPQGASIWYGRVTPHEVSAIVQNTIIEGKILPSLLRGGFNISRPGCRSLNDW